MAKLETTFPCEIPVTLVPDALKTATPTLRDLATWVGTSYALTRAWRLGTRTPSPDLQRKLARAFRKHAMRLEKFADRLERSIKEV